MFKNNEQQYISPEVTPIAIGGVNSSPYMQEMLKREENRRKSHDEETYNRRQGYIR